MQDLVEREVALKFEARHVRAHLFAGPKISFKASITDLTAPTSGGEKMPSKGSSGQLNPRL